MKIGIVTTWFERGAAYVSRQYMKLFESHGVETFIYARGGENQARNDPNWDLSNVTWAKPGYVPYPSKMDRKDFLGWIRKNAITAVLFNEQHWMPAVLWARDAGVLTLAYIDYYTDKTIPFHAVYDGLVCNTQRHLSVFDWHPQCKYIPWGTDLCVFEPSAPTRGTAVRADPENCVFFHSAGMSPYRKGTDLAIEAFYRMKYSERARLVIHTQVELGRQLPSVAALVSELEHQGRLTVIHREVSAPGLYHLGDVYVYPSRLEGVGLTQVEALASGLPIITPANPPMSEFVSPDSGLTVPVEKYWSRFDGYYWPMCQVNVDALAGAMDQCAIIPDIGTLKQRARVYAEKNLDWSVNGEPLLEWVQSLKRLKLASALRSEIIDSFPRDSLLYWLRARLKGIFGI